MKRIKRDPGMHEVVSLYAAMAPQEGLDLRDDGVVGEFSEIVGAAFGNSRAVDTVVYGQRTEAMFAFVVGGLGKASLIKKEDQGEAYTNADLRIPDYRLILNNGTRLLVEVKNVHAVGKERRLKLKRDYVAGLARYAELDKSELRFAVYYSRWAHWVLLPTDAFEDYDESTVAIDLMRAFARSEMSRLGDLMVGTTPDLVVLLEADRDKSEILSGKRVRFYPKQLRFFCNDQEITRPDERRLAYYFTRYGRWVVKSEALILEDETILGVKVKFSPEDPPEGQAFSMLGAISTMISRAFLELTTDGGRVRMIYPNSDPEELSVLIPEDYDGQVLKLWILEVVPNYETVIAGAL